MPKKHFGSRVEWAQESYDALKNSDGLIVVTEGMNSAALI